MANEDVAAVDRVTRDGDESHATPKGPRFRLVPPAVTPIRLADVVGGLRDHRRGVGREAFRAAFASLLDAESTATYTSYRRALGACLRGIADDATGRDTVLIPAFASQDFAAAIEGVGLAVDRYDVDPETLSMDLASVTDRLNRDTLALVAVALLGYSSPMDEVRRVCSDRDVALVEAVGYAVGSTYDGRPLGSFGDYAVVNFQEGKPVPVGGGLVASRDETVAVSDAGRPATSPNVAALAGYAAVSRPRPYRAYEALAGWLERLDAVEKRATTHPGSTADAGYEPPFATMSNFQGAVGRRVFDRLAAARRSRARAARFYRRRLADCENLAHVRPIDGLADHQHVRYPVLIEPNGLRSSVERALRAAGVQTSAMYDWPPVDPDRFPGAASVQRRILTLPTHPYTEPADRRRVVETIRTVTGTD